MKTRGPSFTTTAGALMAALGSALLIVSAPALASPEAATPVSLAPGNNGTVKIDGVDFDDVPNNEPHVSCTFQVDFYGFDEGDLNATVTFEDQAPTADGGLSVTSGQGNPSTVFIGEDPAGGGTDLDASETYTLAFTREPHPQQGYHVKLTVNAEGSQGADTKHKVFWVTECVPPTTTEPTTTEPTTTEPTTTEPTTTEPTSTEPTTEPSTSTVPTSVAPSTSTSPVESSTPPSSVAPSTSESPEVPGAPTDFDAGLPGSDSSSDSGIASRSPWALAGFASGLALAASGVTILIRRPGDAS